MNLVMIGDVGVVDDMVHIGDEAMFEAAAGELDARGARVTAITSNVDETTARYDLPAVTRIRFDGLDRSASEARLAAVWDAAEGRSALPRDDAAHAVIAAVSAARGVVIAGGGNLASTWPLHVYERAALAGIARRLAKPLVVSGQTLGPSLHGRDRALVAEMLRDAALIGVREAASHALARDLGVDARLGVDDASFLGLAPGPADAAPRGVLVSLSLSLGGAPRAETVARIARLVDAAAETTGHPVTFHAHYGPAHEPAHGASTGAGARGDALLHDEVRAAMRTASAVLPSGDARGSAALARSSALLITGRYHPAVFAAPAGVPVLGLITDEYTATKQRGALAHWGQDAVAPIAGADTAGVERVAALWAARAQISAEAARRLPGHRSETTAWWDAVAAAF